MRKFQKALVAIASASMVLGTMGMAGAASGGAKPASSPPCVTRAQFIYDFDVAAGIMPVYPATSDFSDVAPSSPYYGYVEAATKAGIIDGVGNGRFDPTGCLTRAQIAKIEVLALGDGAAAAGDMTQATTFTDDSSIPAWARGYIVEAVSLGLVHGFPNGSYGPNSDMTASDESFFLAQYKSIENALALTVTASATNVAVGQQVTLAATGTSEPVTFSSSSSNGVISGDTFVASQSGDYTVTGQTTDGLKGTVAITVYGPATALKVTGPSGQVVANDTSTYTVTVDVTDANGNTVGNDSTDQVSLSSSNPGVASVNGGGTATVTNGVATFTLTAGSIPGASTTLTASASGFTNATATVASTAQVATSLGATATKYVEANDSMGSGTLSVEVDDQTGNPMLFGTFPVSVSLTGPATFTDGTTGPESGAYASGNDANLTFDTVQSETGAITFTATSTGLTSGTATSTAVIAGSPTALQATADATSFAEGVAVPSGYNVEISTNTVDSHGYPTGVQTNLKVSASMGGSPTANLAWSSTGIPFSYHLFNPDGTANVTTDASGNFWITDGLGGADAGTYILTVSDPNIVLTSASPLTLTETPDVAYKVVLSPTGSGGHITVPASDPKATFTAQVEDQWDNPVSDSGLPLTFTGLGGANFTLGGAASTGNSAPYSATYQVETGATGSATATLVAPPYTNLPPYLIDVADTANLLHHPGTGFVDVGSTVAANLTVTTLDVNSGSSYYAAAGDTVHATITATDPYGTPVLGDHITWTASNAGLCKGLSPTPATCVTTGTGITNGSGILHVTLTAMQAGAVTLSAQDTTSVSAPQAQTAMNVTGGTIAGFDFFDAAGNNVSLNADTFTAGTQVELWVKPVDPYGNPIVADKTYEIWTDNGIGEWRATATGSDFITTAPEIAAGQLELPIYFTPSNSGTGTIAQEWGVSFGPEVSVGGGTYTVALYDTDPSTTWSVDHKVLNGGATAGVSPNSGNTSTLTLTHGGNGSSAQVNATVGGNFIYSDYSW